MRQVRARCRDSNPLYDIPKLLACTSRPAQAGRAGHRKYTLDQVNQAYQDMNDGKNIRGRHHPRALRTAVGL